MREIESCKDCGKMVIAGDTITITLSEYESLTRYAQIGRERKTISNYRALSRSMIALNPALADFVLEASLTCTTSRVFRLAKAKFGDAVPSRSSVYRFIEMMKRAQRN